MPEHGPVSTIPPHQQESGLVTESEIELTGTWLSETAPTSETGSSDTPWADGWVHTGLPFQFDYDGRPSREILPEWEHDHTQSDGTTAFKWENPETGLRVTWERTTFDDYPAADWVVWFENAGEAETPLVRDVRALDVRLRSPTDREPYTVHGANGGRSKIDDFMPFSRDVPSPEAQEWGLRELDTVRLGSEGTSSSSDLPFFNVATPDNRGMMVGVGWSGGWTAEVSVDEDTHHVRTDVGLDETAFTLQPGERVRSPRALVLFWEGRRLHGHNMLRELLSEEYVPGMNDDSRRPYVTFNTWFSSHDEDPGGILRGRATDEAVESLVDATEGLGTETFTIDAGWYETAKEYRDETDQWQSGFGNWTYDEAKYPGGLSSIAARLDATDRRLGLWFAPELVAEVSPLYDDHPEWIREVDDQDSDPVRNTLRLEEPEPREWFLDRIDDLVENEGLGVFRQDMSPYEYGVDASYRTGISESKHVTGLYALWDAIVDRHPDLVMEGCCGGGRRIDLETVSRFHWHQKSDRWLDAESDQCGLYGANLFLPGGTVSVPVRRTDDYGAWTGFAGQFWVACDPRDDDVDTDELRRQIDLYKRNRHRLDGDFYPLTPCSLDAAWLGYQFHRRDLDEGLVVLFRRTSAEDCPYPADDVFRPHLRGIDPEQSYVVSVASEADTPTMAGAALTSDLEIEVDEPPAAALVTYQAT